MGWRLTGMGRRHRRAGRGTGWKGTGSYITISLSIYATIQYGQPCHDPARPSISPGLASNANAGHCIDQPQAAAWHAGLHGSDSPTAGSTGVGTPAERSSKGCGSVAHGYRGDTGPPALALRQWLQRAQRRRNMIATATGSGPQQCVRAARPPTGIIMIVPLSSAATGGAHHDGDHLVVPPDSCDLAVQSRRSRPPVALPVRRS